MAIVPSKSLTGDMTTTSTDFRNDKVTEINLKLNGNSVHGYPLKITNNTPVWPYWKFNEVTNRIMNTSCAKQPSLRQFRTNQIYAHKFEAEETSQGWVSLNLKLSDINGYTEPHSLGK